MTPAVADVLSARIGAPPSAPLGPRLGGASLRSAAIGHRSVRFESVDLAFNVMD